jgi:hypothetical protein
MPGRGACGLYCGRVVTSPRAADAAQTAARYRAEISGLRRWSRIVLILGTVVALCCALGPIWVVRLGLVPALGAALLACVLAWREIDLERRAHSAAMLAVSRRHGEQLTEERRHNAAVVDILSRRVAASTTLAGSRSATIERLRNEIRRLQGDVSGLRGANSRLNRDLNFRDVAIRDLREVVERHAADRVAAERHGADRAVATRQDDASPDGEVRRLPRRSLRDGSEINGAGREGTKTNGVSRGDSGPIGQFGMNGAERGESGTNGVEHGESGTNGVEHHESGMNGSSRRNTDFLTLQAAITLPNYEDDRRFA